MHTQISALLLAFALSAPAFAEEPAHGEPHAPAAHGDAHAADAHAADAEHGGDHGGHHVVDYTGDHDGDGTPNWRDSDNEEAYVFAGLAFHLFNLAILFAIIWWGASGAIKNGLAQRAATIRKELTDTARERDEARQRYEELGQRLAAFEAEVAEMKATAEVQAKAEEAALVARAHAEAERIAATAERNIRDETIRAQVALRKEAVALAVQLAEQTLKGAMNAEDQTRLAAQFLQSIDGEVANG